MVYTHNYSNISPHLYTTGGSQAGYRTPGYSTQYSTLSTLSTWVSSLLFVGLRIVGRLISTTRLVIAVRCISSEGTIVTICIALALGRSWMMKCILFSRRLDWLVDIMLSDWGQSIVMNNFHLPGCTFLISKFTPFGNFRRTTQGPPRLGASFRFSPVL